MVVDDSLLPRAAAKALLNASQSLRLVGEAVSGAQALVVVESTRPDLVLLDVHMPGMSGIELLETIRCRGDMLPVIVISGRTDAMTTDRARAAGALAVVEKPYQPEEVLCLVRHALDQG